MIIHNYVTGGLNVEEVGDQRGSQSPKAHSMRVYQKSNS